MAVSCKYYMDNHQLKINASFISPVISDTNILKLKAHKPELSCCLKPLMIMQCTDMYILQKLNTHRRIIQAAREQ